MNTPEFVLIFYSECGGIINATIAYNEEEMEEIKEENPEFKILVIPVDYSLRGE